MLTIDLIEIKTDKHGVSLTDSVYIYIYVYNSRQLTSWSNQLLLSFSPYKHSL
jgi:hypothetical protein